MKINEIPPFEFKPFSRKQLKMLTWWQDNSPVSDRFMIVADGSIRAGKALTNVSTLYTPDGKKLMGDIKVGDMVIDRLGNPTMVLGVYPQGEKDCYKITFHDGSSVVCSKEHLWSYKKDLRSSKVYTNTLEYIMNNGYSKFIFPISECVKFNSRDVLIEPYFLGLMLGDGCFSLKSQSIYFSNTEDDIISYIIKLGNKYCNGVKKLNYRAYRFVCDRGKKSKLRKLLEHYNLYGLCSYEKFIPDDYKYNSKEVRYRILAGLLNTDGSVEKSIIRYSTSSKKLFYDVAEVARSLGMFVNTCTVVDKRSNHDNFTLSIRLNDDLKKFLSKKHLSRLRDYSRKKNNFRKIKSIEYVGKKECQCIYVDNPEHLYLTDDFIVTHNTIACITSFILYVMTNYNYMNAALAGKTVLSLRRNIVQPLKQIAKTLNMEIIDHRSENYLEVIKGDISNYLYLFGGKISLLPR